MMPRPAWHCSLPNRATLDQSTISRIKALVRLTSERTCSRLVFSRAVATSYLHRRLHRQNDLLQGAIRNLKGGKFRFRCDLFFRQNSATSLPG